MTKLKLEITQDDIDAGCHDGGDCPIARALKRVCSLPRMKIDLSKIDREQFRVDPQWLSSPGSDACRAETFYLVQPQQIGCKWTQENKIFRSSLWNEAGELVSAGFPKFTNWGENPDNFPVPTSLLFANIVEKMDGSLLIVSKYKGKFILRTRGTVDATKLKNGDELKNFRARHPKVFGLFHEQDTWNFSLLFEWVSPNQRIVINYGNRPQFFLVGIVRHTDYTLAKQDWVDAAAGQWDCLRPAKHSFKNIPDLLAGVTALRGLEGMVVYTQEDQRLHKVKSKWYLELHGLKSQLSSFDKLMDTWFTCGKPEAEDFMSRLASIFDWETANNLEPEILLLTECYAKARQLVEGRYEVIAQVRKLPTRREQAMSILSLYSKEDSGMLFAMLDNKPVKDDDIKKLVREFAAQTRAEP